MSVHMNNDGSFELPKSGATVMVDWTGDGVQVDVYGTPQARAERAGSASVEAGAFYGPAELDAWLIRYGVADREERDGVVKLVGNIMTFHGSMW